MKGLLGMVSLAAGGIDFNTYTQVGFNESTVVGSKGHGSRRVYERRTMVADNRTRKGCILYRSLSMSECVTHKCINRSAYGGGCGRGNLQRMEH